MRREEFNRTLLKERLTALRFLKTTDKKEQKNIEGEIKYINNLLMSEEYSEERKEL